MKLMTFTPEQQAEFDKWVASKPPFIQDMIQRCPPDRLYRLKTAGQRVFIEAYHEDGTVTVGVTGKYNKVAFDRNVFGIPIEDLEECDLPGKDEELGTTITDPKRVDEFIKVVRPAVLAGRRK